MDPEALARFVSSRFLDLADPEKAVEMAAYMKTDMPFYGIQKRDRVPIYREIKKRFAPSSQAEYELGVRALWSLVHREEKYAAIEYALQSTRFIGPNSTPLYEQLIREGAWWDLVDGVTTNLVGAVYLHNRDAIRPVMSRWIEDDDFWIRRTAILSQLKHKHQTDYRQLFDFCLRTAHEKEFFIRKAIGWALREFSKTSPDIVVLFLKENQSLLSGLSFREGARHLVRSGFMSV